VKANPVPTSVKSVPASIPRSVASQPPPKVGIRPLIGADVLLYDGVCALCNGLVRFLLARDQERLFRYAALQSDFARSAAARHGEDPSALSTVLLIQRFGQPDERCLHRSRAALAALERLGGAWSLAARVLGVLPTVLLDAGYRLVARLRYAIFGRYDSCPLPAPEHRDLFVDSTTGSLQ
jgi:predicted DCC family thiol-disulfide oxidoreductase YuxK